MLILALCLAAALLWVVVRHEYRQAVRTRRKATQAHLNDLWDRYTLAGGTVRPANVRYFSNYVEV